MRNRNEEVKLQVFNCVNKIVKIKASNKPFHNDLLKDILELTVKSFKDLRKMDSPSFAVRLSILKTVADVTSCVIMLHLGLIDLIIEMFEYFFSAVYQNPYSEDVYASMQTIMTAILDESADISQELLSVLRSNLTSEIKKSSPAAHKLARVVLASCAKNLDI